MSDALPEPRHVGPVAGGNLRASDADRDQVAAVLNAAYAEGRLTQAEHDERLDKVMTARTFDELVPLTRDLVPMPQTTPVAASAAVGVTVDAAGAASSADMIVAIFGAATRKGRWRVHRRSRVFALFGGVDLDMREAVFDAPVVEMSGAWCFGGLDVKVPAGVEVRDHTVGIFGGTDVRDLGDPQPGAPVLVVKGVTLFGGVSIHGPKQPRKRR
jgi:hypothetical protein